MGLGIRKALLESFFSGTQTCCFFLEGGGKEADTIVYTKTESYCSLVNKLALVVFGSIRTEQHLHTDRTEGFSLSPGIEKQLLALATG